MKGPSVCGWVGLGWVLCNALCGWFIFNPSDHAGNRPGKMLVWFEEVDIITLFLVIVIVS